MHTSRTIKKINNIYQKKIYKAKQQSVNILDIFILQLCWLRDIKLINFEIVESDVLDINTSSLIQAIDEYNQYKLYSNTVMVGRKTLKEASKAITDEMIDQMQSSIKEAADQHLTMFLSIVKSYSKE